MSLIDDIRKDRENGVIQLDPKHVRMVEEAYLAALDALEKAEALAGVMDMPNQSVERHRRYHYDWHRVDDALTAYRTAREKLK